MSKKVSKSFKYAVKAQGDFVLDYSEYSRNQKRPCWFIGRGKVAMSNTIPIPSGFAPRTPREAWQAAAVALKLA